MVRKSFCMGDKIQKTMTRPEFETRNEYNPGGCAGCLTVFAVFAAGLLIWLLWVLAEAVKAGV